MALGTTASAQGADGAHVRLLHAVPGAGAATLDLGSTELDGAFGDLGAYARAAAGSAHLRLATAGGSTLAERDRALRSGRAYTVLALSSGGKAVLRTLPDDAAPGTRLRVFHAAPELGRPDLWLDGRRLAARVRYTASTGYLAVAPGRHTLSLSARASATSRC